MTITLKKEVEEQIEIPVPCFFISKTGLELIGVLDENTVVKIYHSEGHSCISNSEMWLQKSDVEKAYNNWHTCTETQFLEKYSEVEQAMSLHPILAV